MDWNDLQHLFALAKYNTLPHAADSLRVNRTTIARRIARLEEALGAKLVERIGRDLVLTDAGREAAASAEIIDGEFQNLQSDRTAVGPVLRPTPGAVARGQLHQCHRRSGNDGI